MATLLAGSTRDSVSYVTNGSDDQLRRMAGAAATLAERIAGCCEYEPLSDAEQSSRLLRWRAALGDAHDEALLERRLRWDGLDPRRAAELVAPARWRADVALPDWVQWLTSSVFGEPHALRSVSADRVLVADDVVPFEELLVPIVRAARDAVRVPDTLVDPSAVIMRERTLLMRLSRLAQRVLFAEFTRFRLESSALDGVGAMPLADANGKAPRVQYAAFVEWAAAGGMWDVLVRYPVLARLCAEAAMQWVVVSNELFARLESDRGALIEALADGQPIGRVTAIKSDVGDPHDGGRAVSVLTFDSGWRCVYKPRALVLDTLWSDVVQWFGETRPDALALRSARLLPREDYGWIEFVATEECADDAAVERFFERAGMTLALVHALHGTDFHYENLLAAGEYPVLIDHEALLTPKARFLPPDSPVLARAAEQLGAVHDSVMVTGLLPMMRVMNGGEVAIDMGGLTAQHDERIGAQVVYWRFANTDLMKLGRQPLDPAPEANVPRVAGAPRFAAAYTVQLLRGFEAAAHALPALRERVAARVSALRHVPGRFIYRNTALYAQCLDRSVHPRFLADGVERWIDFEALARPFLSHTAECPPAWPILAFEREALERQNIPLLASPLGSETLRLPDGTEIPEFFEQSGVTRCLARLASLDAHEVTAQVRVVRESFLAAKLQTPPPHAQAMCSDTDHAVARDASTVLAHRSAASLSDAIDVQAGRLQDGAPFWLGITRLPRYSRWVFQSLGSSYGDGASGIALFEAARAASVGDDTARVRALRAIADFLDEESLPILEPSAAQMKAVEVGLAAGLSGVMQALAHTGRLLAEPRLIEAARRQGVKLANIVDTPGHTRDVLSGHAGVVLAYLAMERVDPDARWMSAADRYAELLRTPVSNVRRAAPDWSLGWGVLGETFALGALALRREDSVTLAAAQDAVVRHTESLLRTAGPTWHQSPAHMALATGALGLRLVAHRLRVEMPDGFDDCLFALDRRMPTDDLMAGEAGRVFVARTIAHPHASHLAARMIRRHARSGTLTGAWGDDAPQPGFFHGLAGIGWALLDGMSEVDLPAPLA